MNFSTIFAKYGPASKNDIRHWESVQNRIASTRRHLEFLQKCKEHQLTPKGLMFSRKRFTTKSQDRILKETELRLLNNEIATWKGKLKDLETADINLTVNVYARIDHADFSWLIAKLADNQTRQDFKHGAKLEKKFNRLYLDKYNHPPTSSCPQQGTTETPNSNQSESKQSGAAVNLSNFPIDDQALSLLSCGHNFAINNEKEHRIDNIVRLNHFTKNSDEIRQKAILETDKLFSRQNAESTPECKVIRTLQTNRQIQVSKADKGGKIVIMDSEDYNKRMEEHVRNNYPQLGSDPTNRFQAQLRKFLKQELQWDDERINTLAPTHPKPPSIYGQPKLHKPGNPLRPIISQKDSCFAHIARFISKKLNILLNKPNSHIKNGSDFVNKITTINDNIGRYSDCTMVSLDVVDMFPSIEPSEAINILHDEKLNTVSDSEFEETLRMTKNQCISLIRFITESSYFKFKNTFYKQTKGLAMGSSLSPLLADVFMEKFELSVLSRFKDNLPIWYRYYDDTFNLWKDTDVTFADFKEAINAIDTRIQFTFEVEQSNKLTFLDVEVEKQESFTTKFYSKPTSSSGLLHYKSHHPLHLKVNTAFQKLKRIHSFCSQSHERVKEKRNLRKDLLELDYPPKVINKIFRKLQNQNNRSSRVSSATSYLPLYYTADGESQRNFKDLLNTDRKQIAWKQGNTLLQIYKKHRIPSRNRNLKNVIYVIPCSCGKMYIGETKRPFGTRLTEHQRYVRNQFAASHLVGHLHENPDHNINWDMSFVIDTEPDPTLRKLKESVYMALNREFCISEPSSNIDRNWNWLLQKHKFKRKAYGQLMYVI